MKIRIREIDALQVGKNYYILNVSAGISAHAMKETKPEEKQQRGILAYVQNIAKGMARGRTQDLRIKFRR